MVGGEEGVGVVGVVGRDVDPLRRRSPKTTEDLDQEMADYYEQANNTAGTAS